MAGWKEEGVGYVAASQNGGIYTGGTGGCFQVWHNAEALPDQLKVEEAAFKRLPKER